MMRTLQRVLTATAIALMVVAGTAIALAQGQDSPPVTDEPAGGTQVQFIGDPPGNQQTGEWEGDFSYEE